MNKDKTVDSPTIRVGKERIAIVAGRRTPFAKSWTSLGKMNAVDLSTQVARELMASQDLDPQCVDQIIWGTVISVVRSPNVAREVALNLNMYKTPAYSVSRACATGLQSVANAAEMIWAGQAEVVLAGGVDVISDAPVPHKKKVIDTLSKAQKAKGLGLLKTLAKINPLDLFPSAPKLTERYTGLTMGQHAEEMAQNFQIARSEQDAYAMNSHKKAHAAGEAGHVKDHIINVRTPKGWTQEDNLIRSTMDPEKLKRLRPVFDRKHGTITAASSSPLTDGAACILVMSETRAKALGYEPLGFVKSYAFEAQDPRENMLLGNVYSCPIALERAGVSLPQMDLLEIHEAFAAQVLSNLKCFKDADFFNTHLSGRAPLGDIDSNKTNIWGGSIAYGHPFAATGGRLIMHMVDGLKHVNGELGLITACAAGGLGSAMVIERN